MKEITIRRVVPNINSNDLEKSKEFYVEFLGMDLVMDMEWIVTFASKENPTAQISIFKNDTVATPDNRAIFLSIEVSDVDKVHDKAKKQKYKIVYPITDEDWGVRRFFVEDPNGVTINLLTHLK